VRRREGEDGAAAGALPRGSGAPAIIVAESILDISMGTDLLGRLRFA
jgi:hypothetical protein